MHKRIILLLFIIVYTLSLESLYSQSTKSHLVAYYPFDENADDKSGNNQTGIVYGNPQIVNGKIGSAYYFNGINDRIEIKNRVSDDFTFSMWIKTGTSNSGSNGWEGRQLISNENSFRDPKSIQGRDVYLSVLNNSLSLGGCNKNNSDHTMSATTVVTDMDWHFIVASHSGNIATIYIDGKLVIEGKMDLKVGSPILNIGHSISDGQSFNFYKGIIDEVKIYDRGLTQEEILAEYTRDFIEKDTIKSPKSLVVNPTKINKYAVDETGTLSSSQINSLISKLKDFEIQTTNQVVIYIIQSLNGELIEDVSLSVANYNRIGQKDKNNGVLFLIAMNERRLRIEVGLGLENVLTNIKCTQIIREEITPHFKDGNFYEGITKGLNAIISALSNKAILNAKNAYYEGKYLLVLDLLKDFPIDDPLYFEAVALMNQALDKLPRNSNQNFVTVSGRINCGCSKTINGFVVFEDMNTRQNIGRCGITSDGYYCIVLPTGKTYSYYIDSKDFYPLSRVIDFTSSNQTLNHKDNITLVSYEDMKEQQVSVRINNIFFDFNESKLKSESYLELDRMYNFLKDNPEIKVEISGHTDNVGTDEYNQNLSLSRAKTVKDYLVDKGINADRITSKGYGKSNPVATNDTDEGRQLNRRVEFKILKK